VSLRTIKDATPLHTELFESAFQWIKDNILARINADESDYALIGSTRIYQSRVFIGDIDIAVKESLIDVDNLDSVFGDLDYHYNKGLHILSLAYPIPGGKQIGQVDLVLSENMEFTKWMYWSSENSEYKGVYRNLLLRSVAATADIFPVTMQGMNMVEWTQYTLHMKEGLLRTKKTTLGKRGVPIKTKTILERRKVSYSPNRIATIILGPKATMEDTDSFESVLSFVRSMKFVGQPGMVMDEFRQRCKDAKLPLPSEV